MTKEKAYEKLELPIDTDLQVVRQKFQQMHNDFQVQIDGAFNEGMRQRKQQQLEELKEAFAILNESTSMDDSASLPRTEKTFDQKGNTASELQNNELTLDQALSVFGIDKQDTIDIATSKVKKHVETLQQQYDTVQIESIKEAYRKEIDSIQKAEQVIKEWIALREEQEKLTTQERINQEEATVSSSTKQAMSQATNMSSSTKKVNILVYLIPAFLLVGVGGYVATRIHGTNSAVPNITAAKDSAAWNAAFGTGSDVAYTNYIKQYPEGIFTQAAHDSLAQITVRINKPTGDVPKPTVQQHEDNETVQRFAEQQKRIKQLEQQAQKEASSVSTTNRDDKPQATVNTDWKNKYDYVNPFYEGLASVKLNGKWGFVDAAGNEIIPLKYDNTEIFHQGLTKVKLNGKWGHIDKTDRLIIPLKYDSVRLFNDGLSAVKLNGKWGYINKADQLVIHFKYDEAKLFHEDLAPVKLNGKWGYINKTDQLVIPFKYENAYFFRKGLAHVTLNGKQFYINKQDEWVKDY